jgi:hypothetical protein
MLKLIAAAAVLTALPLFAAAQLQSRMSMPLQMLRGGGGAIYIFEPIRLVSAGPAATAPARPRGTA